MKLLLDTHTFIWWADEPEKLSALALAALEDENNRLVLSVVSPWGIQIKAQLGRLKLSLPLRDLIESQQQANELEILPVTVEHVLALDGAAATPQRPLRPITGRPEHRRGPDSCQRRPEAVCLRLDGALVMETG
jgi:PIN domain nuclease of toxin-antitoxin system